MIRATSVRKPLARSSLSMIEMATELTGTGEARSADTGMGVGIGASSGKSRMMAMSTVMHLAAPVGSFA